MSGISVILYDGICNLCLNAVAFISKRMPENRFEFVSIQSQLGQSLLASKGLADANLSTFWLLQEDDILSKSDAAIEVCRHLTGFWKVMVVVKLIPKSLRDRLYDIVAANRYRWFGKCEQCSPGDP